MQFAVNLLSQHKATRKQHVLYQEMVEQAELADELGFDALFVNEHHPFDRPDVLWFQPIPVLAGLATRTIRVRLGTNILILPLYHPVRIAEDIAMIHSMSGGRCILGVAIGYVEEEFRALSVNRQTRVARFVEQIEIVRRLWTEEQLTYEGKHFQLQNVSLPVAALHHPPPPIWVGAEVQKSVERAAKIGDAWLPADTGSIAVLSQHHAWYRAALQEIGKTYEGLDRPLMRETFCAATREEAEETLATGVVSKYRQYWRMGAPQLRDEFPNDAFGFGALKKDRFIVGVPDECIAQIERHRHALGVNHIIFRIQKNGISHQQTMGAIRLLGQHVIPYFR